MPKFKTSENYDEKYQLSEKDSSFYNPLDNIPSEVSVQSFSENPIELKVTNIKSSIPKQVLPKSVIDIPSIICEKFLPLPLTTQSDNINNEVDVNNELEEQKKKGIHLLEKQKNLQMQIEKLQKQQEELLKQHYKQGDIKIEDILKTEEIQKIIAKKIEEELIKTKEKQSQLENIKTKNNSDYYLSINQTADLVSETKNNIGDIKDNQQPINNSRHQQHIADVSISFGDSNLTLTKEDMTSSIKNNLNSSEKIEHESNIIENNTEILQVTKENRNENSKKLYHIDVTSSHANINSLPQQEKINDTEKNVQNSNQINDQQKTRLDNLNITSENDLKLAKLYSFIESMRQEPIKTIQIPKKKPVDRFSVLNNAITNSIHPQVIMKVDYTTGAPLHEMDEIETFNLPELKQILKY